MRAEVAVAPTRSSPKRRLRKSRPVLLFEYAAQRAVALPQARVEDTVAMTWSVHETSLLYRLAECGELSAEELARAGEFSPRVPSREQWLHAMDRLFIFSGFALLAAGLVFFLAWNWPDMHRFAKLALVAGALMATVAVAGLVQPFGTVYRAALFGAAVCTGALLALIGQIYQTGADEWELFVTWTLLMLPFVMLARSTASWALWVLVCNTALLSAIFQGAPWVAFLHHPDYGTALQMTFMGGINLVLLAIFESGATLLLSPQRYVHQLAAIAMLGPLGTGAAVAWWEHQFGLVLACFVVVAGGMFFFYYRVRRDLVLLALAAYVTIAVLTSGLLRALPLETTAGIIWYNAVAVFVIAASALVGKRVVDLHREGRGR